MPNELNRQFREMMAAKDLLVYMRSHIESHDDPHIKSGQTILIVEDNQTVVQVVQNYLGFEGFNCITAMTGEEVMQVVNHVDLVVMDISLPGINGLDIVRAMRLVGFKVPVIVMSAFQDFEHDAMAAGANATLKKTEVTGLADLIRSLLGSI